MLINVEKEEICCQMSKHGRHLPPSYGTNAAFANRNHLPHIV